MSWVGVALGLGSNLGESKEQVLRACKLLEENPAIQKFKVSNLLISKPLGPQDQPDFVNAVACFETNLQPLELLDLTQSLEIESGRVKTRFWGERILDLDILLYGDLVMDSERLTLPHKEMHKRDFVLLPLQEICPDLVVPGRGGLADLIKNLDESFVLGAENEI